jgi:small ligand-binding sensory domain FIST
MQFASAVSREPEAPRAGQVLAESIRSQLGAGSVHLACLFFSSHYAPDAAALCEAIRRHLGPAVLMGCTGEGIIGGCEEIEGSAAVTLWAARLPGVTVTPLRPSFAHDEDQLTLDGWPTGSEGGASRPFFLLLADPFSTPVDAVLAELADHAPGSHAIGGMAGGGSDLGENRLVLNDDIFEEGMVGVALSGPITVRTVVSQGCRPIGDSYVVTRAEHNVIHELGGAPALERLQAAFESLSTEERRIAHQALHVGIVTDEHRNRFDRGDFLVRNLIGADRESGSVAIGDHVREGQTVQFHVRDAQSASEDLHVLLAADRTGHRAPPLGALLFSCCGRGRGLFGRPNHDVSVICKEAGDIPVAGFFAQGEIGPVGGNNYLHGYTASVALFSEPDPPPLS